MVAMGNCSFLFLLKRLPRSFPRDKPLRLKRRGLTMLACATVLGALWALSRSPAFVENAYARRISSQLGRALSIVSGLVPASLAEIALASLATYALVAISVVTIHLIR